MTAGGAAKPGPGTERRATAGLIPAQGLVLGGAGYRAAKRTWCNVSTQRWERPPGREFLGTGSPRRAADAVGSRLRRGARG